jgi:hypothetical protein
MQKYIIPHKEYDIGGCLPAIVSNDILGKIKSLLLREKK